jgi:DNA polymerase-1
MRHALYGPNAGSASIALLVKETSFHANNIKTAYIDYLGANPSAFIAYSLWYDENGKCKADLAKDYLSDLLHSIKELGIKTILVTDAKYFKFLTGETKAATNFIGYALKSGLAGYEDEFDVFYCPNYQAAKYNPKTNIEMLVSLNAFKNFLTGTYKEPGKTVIHSEAYPSELSEIRDAFDYLLNKPGLTVDIEGLSLNFWECGIATISFAWDKHNFISIPVDRGDHAADVKEMLRDFFEIYTGKLIPHNANFDFKVLVYEFWMDGFQDYKGMIDGIQVLTRNFDDTKLIAYLATNNAVENVLGLKALAGEHLGNYAEDDIKDTSKIPLPDLLRYNGKDAIGTWYVFDKFYSKMVADQQLKIYEELFKPSVITLLATELVGMPIFPEKVALAKRRLTRRSDTYKRFLEQSTLMKEFQLDVQARKCIEFTEKAKKKVFGMDDPRITRLEFNPNSHAQVADLLYSYLGLPVLDKTDTGAPATGKDTLAKVLNHAKHPEHKKIIKSLLGLASVEKILSSFIPAFEAAVQMPDGSWRIFGNFNLGGTVSGRLSSSNPNLQNIPSSSVWAKLIKACFGCETGWLFGGADFNSLEDMISALTTRDPNKMKVYIDGYDGHCLRAHSYFGDQMKGINPNDVKSINSIKKLYPMLRQESKVPTFLLTYGGTHHGLMSNLGLDKAEAVSIEDNYHELYKVADQWVADRIQEGCVNGYVTGAFGLRLRTPLLLMNGKGKLGYKAAAEGRTAGNMLGQSYGMLNSRAANEFRERVWASEYKYDILLCGQIHDAIYLIWRNTLNITEWINNNLIDCMEWDGLVELHHPKVKVGAELDIFYPDWSKATTLKNGMTKQDILTLCKRRP